MVDRQRFGRHGTAGRPHLAIAAGLTVVLGLGLTAALHDLAPETSEAPQAADGPMRFEGHGGKLHTRIAGAAQSAPTAAALPRPTLSIVNWGPHVIGPDGVRISDVGWEALHGAASSARMLGRAGHALAAKPNPIAEITPPSRPGTIDQPDIRVGTASAVPAAEQDNTLLTRTGTILAEAGALSLKPLGAAWRMGGTALSHLVP